MGLQGSIYMSSRGLYRVGSRRMSGRRLIGSQRVYGVGTLSIWALSRAKVTYLITVNPVPLVGQEGGASATRGLSTVEGVEPPLEGWCYLRKPVILAYNACGRTRDTGHGTPDTGHPPPLTSPELPAC